MTSKHHRSATAAVLLIAVIGCAPKPSVPAIHADPALRVRLQLSPQAPRQLDPTTFTIHLQDADGKPISGARVTVALAMPAMDMGRNEVTPREDSAGVYVGTGRFTMAGKWRATVTAEQSRHRTVQAFMVLVR